MQTSTSEQSSSSSAARLRSTEGALAPGAPGLRLYIGLPRSGKTYTMIDDVKHTAAAGVPVLAIDRVGKDWSRWPKSWAPLVARVSSVEKAARAVERGKRIVVVQTKDARAAAAEACAWAAAYPGVAGVAVPEAHRPFKNTTAPLPEPVEEAVVAWAHVEVALFLDSQRFAKLHKDITENATGGEVKLFAILGPRDRAAIAEELDPALMPALDTICERWKGGAGERGYYVRLPGTAPYPLRRAA